MVNLLNAGHAKVCEVVVLHTDVLTGPLKTKQVDITYSVIGLDYESWGACHVALAEPLLGMSNEKHSPPDMIDTYALSEAAINAEVSVSGVIAIVDEPIG